MHPDVNVTSGCFTFERSMWSGPRRVFGTVRVMRDTLLAMAAGAFLGGVVFATLAELPALPMAGISCGIGFAVLAYAYLSRVANAKHMMAVAVGCFAVALGIVRFDVADQQASSTLAQSVGETVSVRGTVVEEPDRRIDTKHLTVHVSQLDGASANGKLLAFVSPAAEITYGDRVRLTGRLETPEPFRTNTGTTFDYPQYLAKDNIYHLMYYPTVSLAQRESGNPIVAMLLSVKQTLIDSIQRLIPAPESALLSGLLFGTKHALGDDLARAFRETGVIHIVVLSGYNVTLVADLIMRLARGFPRVARITLAVSAIAGFAVMTGASATVLRASIMAGLVLLARETQRTYAIARALVVAAVLMVAFDPKILVADPGFQLSFVATLGLIYLAPKLSRYMTFVPERGQLREIVTATIATQLFVLPLLLSMTGQVSLVAPIANLFVLIAVPIAMLGGFIVAVVGLLSSILAMPLAYGVQLILAYQLQVVEVLAAIPVAAITVPPIPAWGAWLLYLLGGGGYLWTVQRRQKGARGLTFSV